MKTMTLTSSDNDVKTACILALGKEVEYKGKKGVLQSIDTYSNHGYLVKVSEEKVSWFMCPNFTIPAPKLSELIERSKSEPVVLVNGEGEASFIGQSIAPDLEYIKVLITEYGFKLHIGLGLEPVEIDTE